MTEVQKLKKYLFKFPEGTTTDAQKEYLGKMKEALKDDDWVVINPGIEVYEAHEPVESKAPEANPTVDTVEGTPTETPAEPAKPAETPAATPATPATAADEVKVETVTSTPPVPEEKPKPAFPADTNATAE